MLRKKIDIEKKLSILFKHLKIKRNDNVFLHSNSAGILQYAKYKKNKSKEVYLRYIKTDKNKEIIKIFLENNSFQKVSDKMMDKVKFKGELYKVLLNKKLINVEKFF